MGDVRPIHKNHTTPKSEPKAKSNLIPRDYLKVCYTILGSPEKFDIVMEKVILALDRLEKVEVLSRK